MVSSTDLIAPKGDIEPSLFPSDTVGDLTARMQLYLTQGYAAMPLGLEESVKDLAAKAYAYSRAYRSVYVRLAGDPHAVVMTDQGSRTYTNAQITEFRLMAEAQWSEYIRLTTNADNASERSVGSVSVTTGFSY